MNFQLPYNNPVESDHIALYKNARIIDPKSNLDIVGDLVTKGDKVFQVVEGGIQEQNITPNEIIDCSGLLITPGLIDIQVHFRDPGQTHKEDMISGSKSAVAGGVTTVVCQPNTNPVLDSTLTFDYLRLKAKEQAYCNVLAYGAISKSMKGEELTDMESLKNAGAVGFTDDGLPVMNANLMRKAFEYSKGLGVVLAQHAEDLDLSNKGCINEGEVSVELGVRGIPNISESVIVQRDIAILEAVGGRYHLLHASTKEAVEAIRQAKSKNLSVTCEACPHHFLLTDKQVLKSGTNAKMNPPLRSEEDRQAVLNGLIDGTIDTISTDHAPHDIESKNKTIQDAAFGIVGVETMLPLSLKLYHEGLINLNDLIAKMTCNSAKVINFDGGNLSIGARADLTIIDLDRKWKINTQNFHSKSKNSPFDGFEVKGKAVMTVIAGKIVYQEA